MLEPPPFPNRPRDRNFMSYSPSLDPTLGPARVGHPADRAATGPYIEPLCTQGTEDNATADRRQCPDRPTSSSPIARAPSRRAGTSSGRGRSSARATPACSAGTSSGTVAAVLPAGRSCRRHRHVERLHRRYAVPAGDGLPARLDAGSGLGRPHGHRHLRQRQPARADRAPSANRTSAPCAGTRSSRRAKLELTLAPHLDEIVRSSLTPCRLTGTAGTTGAAGTGGQAERRGMGAAGGAAGRRCGRGRRDGGRGRERRRNRAARAAPRDASQGDPTRDCTDPTDGSTEQFPMRRPAGQPRCLDPCTKQQDVVNGRVCLRTCEQDSRTARRGCDDLQERDVPDRTGCATARRLLVRRTAKPATSSGHVRAQPSFCADGPPLVGNDGCFPQLTAYQVNVGAGFMVTGTQAGSFASASRWAATVASRTVHGRDPRLVSRIPLRPAPGAAGVLDRVRQPPDQAACSRP